MNNSKLDDIFTMQEKKKKFCLKNDGIVVPLVIIAFVVMTFFFIVLECIYWWDYSGTVQWSVLIFVLILWASGIFLFLKKKYPKMGQGLCCYGAGLWFLSIILYYGNIKNAPSAVVANEYMVLPAMWGSGIIIFALPFMLRMRWLFLLIVILLLFWVQLKVGEWHMNYVQYCGFIFGGILFCIYVFGKMLSRYVKSYFIKDYGVLLERLGLFLFLGFFVQTIASEVQYGVDSFPDLTKHPLILWAILPLGGLLFLLYQDIKGRKESYWSVLTVICLGLLLIFVPFYINSFFYWGLYALLAISLMANAVTKRSRFELNFGTWLFAYSVVDFCGLYMTPYFVKNPSHLYIWWLVIVIFLVLMEIVRRKLKRLMNR